METIQGKIEKVSVEEGLSKSSGKPFKRWVFLINEKKFSTFDMMIGENFKMGDFVSMEGEQNGQYWNMKTMQKVSENIPPVSKPMGNSDLLILDLLRQILAELKMMNGANGDN